METITILKEYRYAVDQALLTAQSETNLLNTTIEVVDGDHPDMIDINIKPTQITFLWSFFRSFQDEWKKENERIDKLKNAESNEKK